MKTRGVFLLLLLAARAAMGGDAPVPVAMPGERYDGMSARSPFTLASAAPIVAASASFAANWYVSGIARLNDEDFVSIKARDLSTQFSLFGREANPQNGVALASVQWSDTVGKSTVILRKGTETARLEFNEAELRNAPRFAAATPTAGATPAIAPATGALSHPPEVRRRALPIPVPR